MVRDPGPFSKAEPYWFLVGTVCYVPNQAIWYVSNGTVRDGFENLDHNIYKLVNNQLSYAPIIKMLMLIKLDRKKCVKNHFR